MALVVEAKGSKRMIVPHMVVGFDTWNSDKTFFRFLLHHGGQRGGHSIIVTTDHVQWVGRNERFKKFGGRLLDTDGQPFEKDDPSKNEGYGSFIQRNVYLKLPKGNIVGFWEAEQNERYLHLERTLALTVFGAVHYWLNMSDKKVKVSEEPITLTLRHDGMEEPELGVEFRLKAISNVPKGFWTSNENIDLHHELSRRFNADCND